MSQTDISIVIPTFNSSRTISQCLDSIHAQTVECKELFVVDRYSTDGTSEIALEGDATLIQNKGNRSVARNIGLSRSTSSGVLFIDSDMILPRMLVEECLEGLECHAALVIPEGSIGSGFWAQCKKFERETYSGDKLVEAARCFSREFILSIGGYDSKLEAGEDWDLQTRAVAHRGLIGRVRSTLIHDEGRLTLANCMRKKFFYGRAMNPYLTAYPHSIADQLNPMSRVLNATAGVLRRHPRYAGGVLLLKSVEFTSAGLGHIASKLDRSC